MTQQIETVTHGMQEAVNILRANLCVPYVKGERPECDVRMRDIHRIELAIKQRIAGREFYAERLEVKPEDIVRIETDGKLTD